LTNPFDYIFYRAYTFFRKQDNFIPITKASGVVSILQCFTILDLVIFARVMYPFPFPSNMVAIPVIFGVGVLNWYQYERNLNISELVSRWTGEDSATRVRNGWLISVWLVVSFLILPIHGTLTN
jgi:hypothetical protein